jgi:hypothetical protein
MALETCDGTAVLIAEWKVVDEPFTAYNLEVANSHTYFVADNSNTNAPAVLVHNDCWRGEPPPGSLPTGTNDFGQNTFRGRNGEEIYQGHDGNFYNAAVHAPTSRQDWLNNLDSRPLNDISPDASNGHLNGLPFHPQRDRAIIRADKLVDRNNVRGRHPINEDQITGNPDLGIEGVENLTNEELLRFGGPNGSDPISIGHKHLPGDTTRLPGSRIEVQTGHHRLEEIARRVEDGRLPPDTIIEVSAYYGD